jgi:hypothetical protein
MAIEIQTGPGVKPGGTYTFTFKKPVQAYVLGLSGFTLSYLPQQAHWVQTISLSLNPNQVEGNSVSVTIEAELEDHSGNTIDVDNSFIYPACVAITGVDEGNTLLEMVSAINSGSSAQVSLPGTNPSVAFGFPTGFYLSFDTTDHEVLQFETEASLYNNNGTGELSVNAVLMDKSGDQAVTATVNGGCISSSETVLPFGSVQVTNQNGQPVKVSFPGLTSVSAAVVLLQKWNVQFSGNDQSINSISIGNVMPSTTVSGNTVTINHGLVALMWGSNEIANPSYSFVNAVVVAIP